MTGNVSLRVHQNVWVHGFRASAQAKNSELEFGKSKLRNEIKEQTMILPWKVRVSGSSNISPRVVRNSIFDPDVTKMP
jgi:hypothetical protein